MATITNASALLNNLLANNRMHLTAIEGDTTFVDSPESIRLAIATHSIALESFVDQYEERYIVPLRQKLNDLGDKL